MKNQNKTSKTQTICHSEGPMIGTHEITIEEVIVTYEIQKQTYYLSAFFKSLFGLKGHNKKKIRIKIMTPDIDKVKPKKGDLISSPLLFKIDVVGSISIFATSERYLTNEEIASVELFNGVGKLWKI